VLRLSGVFSIRRLRRRCCHTCRGPLSDWRLVQSFRPAKVALVWVESTRCAVEPFLPAVRFVPRQAWSAKSITDSSSLRVGLHLGHYPTKPSRWQLPSAPPMSFAALQHIKHRRSTRHGLCLPATFRPQGLATLSTVYSLRSPAGSISRRRHSWAFPFGA
jgi:hypothetical protein